MARSAAAAKPLPSRRAPARRSASAAPARSLPSRRRSGPAPARPQRPARAPVKRRKPASRRRRAVRGVASRTPGVLAAVHGRTSTALDRLLRGRGWIVLVGGLLVGIVFLNVALLGMNKSTTRDAARVEELGRQNSQLRTEVARLGSSERIQKVAAERGLVLPEPGDVRYLHANSARDARLAARRTTAPSQLAGTTTPEPRAEAPAADVNSDGDPTNDVDVNSDGDPTNDVPDVNNDGDPTNDTAAATPTGGATTPAGAPVTTTTPGTE